MKFAVICAMAMALAAPPVMAQAEAAPSEETQLPPDKYVPVTLDAAARQAVEGINAFSLDLYKQSITPDENLFISPASVSTAVGLAYRGARGTTAEELRTVMHFGVSPEAYLPANAAVMQAMDLSGRQRQLHLANSIWIQQGLPLAPDYLADVTRYAKAGLEQVDFKGDPDASRTKINDWVEARTSDRIKDLLTEENVKESTRAVLVNSIYWKGEWLSPFEASQTKSEPFTGLDGKHVATSLMTQRTSFAIVQRDGVKAIRLPFVAGEISMIILLPNAQSGLPRLEAKLTHQELGRWLSDLDAAKPRDTILTMPKMHLEWRRDIAPSLVALGAKTAFSDDADFKGIAMPPFPGDGPEVTGLKFSAVIHKTFLDVDEKGSEAAAATALVMAIITSRKRGPPPPPPFIFRADKPFLFLLKDQRTNEILFMGRYVKPQRD